MIFMGDEDISPVKCTILMIVVGLVAAALTMSGSQSSMQMINKNLENPAIKE